MDPAYYTDCIVRGMETYFRSFAMADTMLLHKDDIEWISPVQGAVGPRIVFRVSLDEHTAREQLEALIPDLQSGVIPRFWVVPPTSTPANILELLLARGFRDISDDEHPELGMALDTAGVGMVAKLNPSVEVRLVDSFPRFATWVKVVNEALHERDLLEAKAYSVWLSKEDFRFYLAYLDGIPVSTVATMAEGDTASIEFMSTLKEHRGKGAGTRILAKALLDLKDNGIRTVTLRSSNEAIPLYTKAGFRPYYIQKMVSYGQ